MKFNPNRLWIVAILLGWIFDFLFWKQETGFNFALFSTLCLLGGFGLLLADGFRPARKSLWLLLPFAFFAVIAFLRQEPLTIFLAYTFAIFSVGVLASTYLGGRWIRYSLADYLRNFFQLIGSMLWRGFVFYRDVNKEQAGAKKPFLIWAVLRGLLIALPIVLCFGSLLASADVIFNQIIARIFEDFNPGEEILQALIILACAYLLVGVFLHTASHSRDEKLLGEEQPLVKQFLGFTESSIVLGSVAVLFLIFVVIQFQYFFGGQTNIGVEGFTYSQYARRGFNELITVAFFSLVMILSLGSFTRRENETERRAYSALSVVIVAEVMVILVSAFQRINLAIDWHGYSRLRLYPQIFLVWLGLLLIVVAALEVLRRERYLAFAAALASIGFAVSLSVFNVDASIVTHNLERVAQGKNLNVPHLASLSADAVPALVEKFNDPFLPTDVHEGVGAILVCYVYSIRPDKELDWRSFNLSNWQARESLQQIQPQLTTYRYNDKKGPPRIRTPNNVLYECVEDSNADAAD